MNPHVLAILEGARSLYEQDPESTGCPDVLLALERITANHFPIPSPLRVDVPDWPSMREACRILVGVQGPGWKARDGALEPHEGVLERSDRLRRSETLVWFDLAIAHAAGEALADTERAPAMTEEP